MVAMLLQNLPLTSPFHQAIRFKRGRTNYLSPLFAAGEESDFDIDQDRAREALQKLDQQIQSLSNSDVAPPRKKKIVPELDLGRPSMKEDMPELTDSDFAYSAAALVALTILYNVIFITVIKPAVDGP